MDDLTPQQKAAVEHIDGPLLILAGPGSGKTRVITRRIAHLIEEAGVSDRNVLAITFTNKAAGEMAERVRSLLPDSRVWMSTFHKFCARLLREHGEMVGLRGNFSILDAADQKQAIRLVMQDLDFDTTHFPPNKIAYQISNAKNDLLTPEMFDQRYEHAVADHFQAVVHRVYPAYQKYLLDANSVDFDDLLLHTAMLLAENPELREDLDDRYRYVLVDEYQDTNLAQYQIVAALSQKNPNLCVTGDPDQSIYGWRGARIENILRFERDYPNAKTIRLEQNFRSTPNILRSADSLIVNNSQRKAKTLTTDQHEGAPVQVLTFPDAHTEAEGIAMTVQEMVDSGDYNWSDIAIFYRVNALSRQLELSFMRHRIPVQVAAGTAFYDRTEVKDLLGYLRLVENPEDHSAFMRVVNKPLRGLGKTSQNRLLRWSETQGITPLEACERAYEVPKLSKRAAGGFRAFASMMQSFSLADAGSVGDLLVNIIDRTHYTAPWEGSSDEKDRDQLANVEELVNSARLYDRIAGDDMSLQGFLEQSALASEIDWLDNDAGEVTLMTLHAAKGLEYPVVFIVGVEEGLIPHERSKRENAGVFEFEEERRLLFVGMTRAKKRLYLTETKSRALHGKTLPTIRSPFLGEIEAEFTDFGTEALSQELPAWAMNPRKRPEIPIGLPKLTTAADLLNGSKSAVEIPKGFAIGANVRHPRYGTGVVIDVGGFGARRTVTVRFSDDDRTEKFVASKAPLQPVG